MFRNHFVNPIDTTTVSLNGRVSVLKDGSALRGLIPDHLRTEYGFGTEFRPPIHSNSLTNLVGLRAPMDNTKYNEYFNKLYIVALSAHQPKRYHRNEAQTGRGWPCA